MGLSLEEAMTKISDCAQIAAKAASPIDDVRATASYRRTIIDVFVNQCARKVLNTLNNGGGRQNARSD
jgi:CO/xanthine dehydrogenase FAD-binding subunit